MFPCMTDVSPEPARLPQQVDFLCLGHCFGLYISNFQGVETLLVPSSHHSGDKIIASIKHYTDILLAGLVI